MYNPAALPLATSAFTADEKLPFFRAASLSLANSFMCLSKSIAYLFWTSSLNSPMYWTTNGYVFGFLSSLALTRADSSA